MRTSPTSRCSGFAFPSTNMYLTDDAGLAEAQADALLVAPAGSAGDEEPGPPR